MQSLFPGSGKKLFFTNLLLQKSNHFLKTNLRGVLGRNMAIILDDIQRQYLKELLQKHPSSWWPHQKILSQIEADEERLKNISECKHKYAHYKGEKTCCVYCDSFKEGSGFSWTLDEVKSSSE